MFTIGKTFTFEAAHWLPGLPDGHKCARQHGHSYTVEVELCSEELTPPGFVVDFGDLAPLKRHLDERFDHQQLNEVAEVAPTSENLARLIFDWCCSNLELPAGAMVAAVRVKETAGTWARYEPTPAERTAA